jgi:hypothetical protein
MIWKSGNPQNGEKRIILRFAFFPKKINEYTVWLSWYYELQEYIVPKWLIFSYNKPKWATIDYSVDRKKFEEYTA